MRTPLPFGIILLACLVVLTPFNQILSDDQKPEVYPWSFLSTSTIGAYQFIKANPTYDGRGVVIIICDTGVDMGVPGLQKTSTGETKVIDVQDFSGEGDVEIVAGEIKSENGEHFICHPDGGRLFNYDRLDEKPINGKYWIGFLDEERFKNSRVKDINNNGRRDDRFGVLTFKVKEDDWVTYVDTDADGNIDDERPIRDYKVNFDTFHMRSQDNSEKGDMTFALNIKPDEGIVSFHFADNPHGTHVAGIAAGYRINDQETLNGIAPGAKIISLKIGDCTLAGAATVSGSMRKALDYGINYAKEHNVPVVFNISYGIGSEIEGWSDIDKYVDEILRENEDILICLSAGNEGPGISSVGTPAASFRAISVGAMLPVETARDCYGASIKGDKILVFSSRGGEIPKPDLLAPGAASSTVPPYTAGDRMSGTSMASPQIAGACALLISAAIQQDPPIPYNGALIKRALKNSAREIPGYNYLDQGAGVPYIPRAFEILKRYGQQKESEKLLNYKITTKSPIYPNDRGPAAYWRMGGYFPRKPSRQTFRIKPIFPEDMTREQKARFYRAFDLRSTAPWLKSDKRSVYIKGERAITVNVSYDERQLKDPGVYVGKIVAYRKEGKGDRFSKANVEFELLNTVIIPYIFHPGNDYKQEFRNQKLEAGDIRRYFILIPPGASSGEILLSPSPHKQCRVRAYIFDPKGHTYARLGFADSQTDKSVSKVIPKSDLVPGIWEVVTYASFANKFTSYYELTISFTGFKIEPEVIDTFDFKFGEKPKGSFYVINLYNQPFKGVADGMIEGYKRKIKKEIKGRDTFTYHFTLSEEVEMVVFDLLIPPESFNKFTDIAVNILDPSGRAEVKRALTYGKETITFFNPGGGDYTYQIKGALTHPDGDTKWEFELTEYYYTMDKIPVSISKNGRGVFDLYPGVKTKLEFELAEAPSATPDGFLSFGTIDFMDHLTERIKVSVPITFKLTLNKEE